MNFELEILWNKDTYMHFYKELCTKERDSLPQILHERGYDRKKRDFDKPVQGWRSIQRAKNVQTRFMKE